MSESSKVQPHHLGRGAYLYIRQSSPRQVLENVESGKRQYALRGRAVALGWHDDQIIVIDDDQGESGCIGRLARRFSTSGHRGRHGQRRHRHGTRGLAPGEKQRGLASFDRNLRVG